MQQIFQLFTFQLVSSTWNDSFRETKRERKGDEMGPIETMTSHRC